MALVKITEKELAALLEVAERAARRQGRKVVLRWDRINLNQQLGAEK